MRLATASETEDGKRLADGKTKNLTGNETITARFMRQEFFDFRPQFKLFFATNQKQEVRGAYDGIWDRIRLIPFKVRIQPHEMDKHHDDKLAAEAPGILAWGVRGCLAWQRDADLGDPKAVTAATDGAVISRAYRYAD